MVASRFASFGIGQVLKAVRADPDRAIPRLLDGIDIVAQGEMTSQRRAIRDGLTNRKSNVYKLAMRALRDVDPAVFDRLARNFITHAGLGGWRAQKKLRERYGCNIPWAILLDPTSACNLACTGCWAADYGNRHNLSLDEIDSIVRQGKQLGVYMYIYTGGEPLVRRRDLVRICSRHPECVFLSFTNGTLIDQEFCDEMRRVKNFVPAISVEGDRKATDARRGEGTHARVVAAMDLMCENRLPFGVSCCYTSQNLESLSSDDFVDELVERGALFAWFFHYMPVGSDADVGLMCTPEQREHMYHTVRRWRTSKPIFPMDFQNDGQFTQGCIAGGRRYLHINAAGDVDPCVFVHFSDSNIREKTLLECLQSPLFMAYRDGQPFNENMLKPCPMLENPDELRSLIARTGAKPSNLEGDETVEELCARCDSYARAWGPTAERLWELNHHVAAFGR